MFELNISVVYRVLKAAVSLSLLIVAGLLFSASPALAVPPNTMPIWRAQVRFVTANVVDAGTDDTVKVGLNYWNNTWIDSDLNDFESGTRTYDLRLDSINQLSDIDYLRVEKVGTDGWAIQQMSLIINGVTIYHVVFSPIHWLDNETGYPRVYFADDYFMRQRSHWINYTPPVRPSVIPKNDMRLRIESILGDFVINDHNNSGTGGLLMHRIGTYGTELFTLNANTWRIDLDLEADDPVWNVDIDVDFDLTVLCWNGRPIFSVSNVNAHSSPDRGATDRARAFINGEFRFRLNEMVKNFNYSQCPSMVLSSAGDLHFYPSGGTYNPPNGPIGGGGGVILPLFDNPSPLGLNIVTGDKIKPFAETVLTTTVKSGLTEDIEADLSFELSSQIVASDIIIEAKDPEGKDPNGTRQIAAQLVRQSDGTSLIMFRDHLIAGKYTEYSFRLIFQPTEDKTEHIITRVVPVTSAATENIMPLRTVTSFRSNPSLITPLGTITRSSEDLSSDEESKVILKL